jgi:hypothetical protein
VDEPFFATLKQKRIFSYYLAAKMIRVGKQIPRGFLALAFTVCLIACFAMLSVLVHATSHSGFGESHTIKFD